MKTQAGFRAAFTLIELLTTIAIIAVIASLLLPALSQAKGTAQLARCGGNLRQIGIASSAYVSDWNAYTPYIQVVQKSDGSAVAEFWTDKLQNYCGASWADDVYQCPGNRFKTVRKQAPGAGTGSFLFPNGVNYDLNAFGVGLNSSFGLSILPRATAPNQMRGCKESDIFTPSQMFAVGDAVPLINCPASSFGHGAYFYVLARAVDYSKSRAMSVLKARHNQRWNVGCSDGHIESFGTGHLFGNRTFDTRQELMRRRWNRDAEPHWEELSWASN